MPTNREEGKENFNSDGDDVGKSDGGGNKGESSNSGMPDFSNDEEALDEASEAADAIIEIAKKKNTIDETAQKIRRNERDIVQRAKLLMKSNCVHLEEISQTKGNITKNDNSDWNRYVAFEILFGGEGMPDRPHFDTFKGQFVDWRGMVIEKEYDAVDVLLEALAAMGMKNQKIGEVMRCFVIFAVKVKKNMLIERFLPAVPQWDGIPRMEESLISLFKCFDTPFNRHLSIYFWLSLYCRIVSPGCEAPVVLSLFGRQYAGKSRFQKLICREYLMNPKADVVQFDMAEKDLERIRDVTGNSIIASIGDMTGFGKADLNKIKAFLPRTMDHFHQKFGDRIEQQRQWITILDSNEYTGLQRDNTGNRRFAPMFVAQLPDKDGQPDWDRKSFEVDFTGFSELCWNIAAECRSWLETNGGIEGYELLAKQFVAEVAEFNDYERSHDRGTVRDDDLETYFIPVLLECKKRVITERKGGQRRGVLILDIDFSQSWDTNGPKNRRLNKDHYKTKMMALGGEAKSSKGYPGVFFEKYWDIDRFCEFISQGDDDYDEVDVKSGGF